MIQISNTRGDGSLIWESIRSVGTPLKNDVVRSVRGLFNIAHFNIACCERCFLTQANARLFIDCLPAKLGCLGCSFQFGRTSMFLLPHLPHFTRERNHGTSVSGG